MTDRKTTAPSERRDTIQRRSTWEEVLAPMSQEAGELLHDALVESGAIQADRPSETASRCPKCNASGNTPCAYPDHNGRDCGRNAALSAELERFKELLREARPYLDLIRKPVMVITQCDAEALAKRIDEVLK